MFAFHFANALHTKPAFRWMVVLCLALIPSYVLASGHAAKPAAGGHGAKPAGGHGAKPAGGHGGHGAKPAGGHGAKPAGGHGAEKKSGHGAEKKSAHGSGHGGGHGSSHGSGHGSHGDKKSGHGNEHATPAPPDPTYAPELAELLTLIESKQKKNDPLKFSELDLGEYKLTHAGPGEGKMATITFHIFAVIPEDKMIEITDKIPAHEKRMRDTILSTVHEATYAEISEPSMITVKERLAMNINRVLNAVEVRDVVFSNLSTKLMH